MSDDEYEEEDSGPFSNAQEEKARDSESSQDGAVADTNKNISSTTASQPSSSSSSVPSDQQVNNVEFIISLGKQRSRSSLNTTASSAGLSVSLSSSLLSRDASQEEAADVTDAVSEPAEAAVDLSQRSDSPKVVFNAMSLRSRSVPRLIASARSAALESGSRASSNPS